jgi:hypothetical protein
MTEQLKTIGDVDPDDPDAVAKLRMAEGKANRRWDQPVMLSLSAPADSQGQRWRLSA